ncbi:MAG: SAM hydrolase/SAM-dependent halogenase family protein, partial [Thermodesulfobacteriota bacterium]
IMYTGIITLTTDFGLIDPYVGAMKGVILSINPRVRIIDISHQVGAGDIEAAARLLKETYSFFPTGSIHLGVVDPGVGSSRRAIGVYAQGHLFVGPDNGLFWPILSQDPDAQIIHLTKSVYFRPQVSHTFHGRDLFAPVAAHLSAGVDLHRMGELISDPAALNSHAPQLKEDTLTGHVTTIDHFGNLITDIGEDALTEFLRGRRPLINLGELSIRTLHQQYADVPPGHPLALVSSSGYLEIAVNQGRADHDLGVDEEKIHKLQVLIHRI